MNSERAARLAAALSDPRTTAATGRTGRALSALARAAEAPKGIPTLPVNVSSFVRELPARAAAAVAYIHAELGGEASTRAAVVRKTQAALADPSTRPATRAALEKRLARMKAQGWPGTEAAPVATARASTARMPAPVSAEQVAAGMTAGMKQFRVLVAQRTTLARQRRRSPQQQAAFEALCTHLPAALPTSTTPNAQWVQFAKALHATKRALAEISNNKQP